MDVLTAMTSPRTYLLAVVVMGFFPGLVLRALVRLYPKDHPRREELLGELYALPWWERPFFVAQVSEAALCEGVPSRIRRGATGLVALAHRIGSGFDTVLGWLGIASDIALAIAVPIGFVVSFDSWADLWAIPGGLLWMTAGLLRADQDFDELKTRRAKRLRA